MSQTICILTLLIATSVFGQIKDRRAELNIHGLINEISISPDERNWIVSATGQIYFTENIDSNWHYVKPLFESTDGRFKTNRSEALCSVLSRNQINDND